MNAILNALAHHARQTPEKLAFFGHDAQQNPHSLTYQQLAEQVDWVAEQLRRLAPQCIALRAENSLDWVVVDLAAMQAGIAIVPVPTFFSDTQTQHTLLASGADLLIGDWPGQGDEIEELSHLSVRRNPFAVHAERLAGTSKITFTSGSTGAPKGVCLSNTNLTNVTTALAAKMDAHHKTHLVLLPLSTLLENITGIYVPLLAGVTSTIFCGPHVGLTGSSQFDATALASALARYQPASLVLTPALLMALIHIIQAQPALAKPLRFVAVGGARVAPELMQTAHQLSIPAYEGYGLSECASVVSLNTPHAFRPGSCGQVLEHVEIRVDKSGELLVRGNIALGYLGEPFQQTWLPTGDLAAIDTDGFVHLMGRKKNQIITSYGRNISPEWIESQAQIFLPGSTLIVTGDAEASLTAVTTRQPSLEEKIVQLNATLPDYARIGRLIVVNDLRQRPDWFTDNGRPKRQHIEAWVKQLAPVTPQPNIEIRTLANAESNR
ncbi:AMP-binding protein [Vibrio proteolyticus]